MVYEKQEKHHYYLKLIESYVNKNLVSYYFMTANPLHIVRFIGTSCLVKYVITLPNVYIYILKKNMTSKTL